MVGYRIGSLVQNSTHGTPLVLTVRFANAQDHG